MPTVNQRKTHDVQHRPPFECTALLLQGGGALAAYQAGVYEALAQAGTPSSQKPPRNSSTPAAAARFRGHMDVQLVVDAMELAEHVDEIVLFSGNGDFRSPVEAVQRCGVCVTVVSAISSQPPMIADELRRQAGVFTDLVELQSKLGHDPSEHPGSARSQSITLQCVRRRAPRAG
ncbi:NYN domain-containing protein [Bradyrhizobium sp. Ash2021]|uniref:NYN domain-containing protein n=1 Tax=Bradyrhizobium sp. Ash2021 TaxID=2954771 RepID=UPI00281697C5|nr:NYN domain-containing protein [Bradyrhizobium sp. Ash2021]WMT73908.1 NYN domain-containing protein [Bradyrhizobium sp. Ash2021]